MNQNPDEREVDPSKANGLLARYALTHDSTVAQHAQVIVEHFVAHSRGRLGGRAKSMVVTASRQSAVEMARAIKSYLKDRDYDTKYPDLGVLVAFSGSLTLDGEETTEPKENGGLSESALPKAFAYTRADDKAARAGGAGQREYRILVVAEKYQTGFDQPLLTTMYVNKSLTGISAVQTLSRLNRTAERKTQADLAVLDFVNDANDIQDSFRPYFEEANTLPSDPNLLYTAQSRVMQAAILSGQEMDEFAAAYFAAKEKAAGSQSKWEKLHAELYRRLSPPSPASRPCSKARTRTTRRPRRASVPTSTTTSGSTASSRRSSPTRTPSWSDCTSTAATSSTGCRAGRTAVWTSARSTSAICGWRRPASTTSPSPPRGRRR